MDEKKKQIVMLCVLGALVVGAGSYYFLIRDSGNTRKVSKTQGLAKRKVRQHVAKTDTRKRKKRSRQSKVPTIKAQRKERRASNQKRATRKKRRGVTKKIKKKTQHPAA